MRRISIVGNSGSGKSTTGAAIAARLDIPYIELDAVHHLAAWTPIDPDAFVARVGELTSGDAWVVDGNYRVVVREGPVWERVDTVVWLDVPRWLTMWQVSKRTIGRAITRRELWNGNREEWRNIVSWAPERNMMRWTWTRHHQTRQRYEQLLEPPPVGVEVFRLRSRREIEQFLDSL